MKHFVLALLVSGLAMGCAKTEDHSMTSDTATTTVTASNAAETKAHVQKFYDAFNAKDTAAMMASLADNFTDHNPSPGQPAGKAGVMEAFKQMWMAFPDMKFTVEDMTAEGNNVAVRATMSGTMKGDFMGMKASNKQFNVMGFDYLKLNDQGQATDRWGAGEEMKMMQQLGMMPSEPAKKM